MPIHGLTFIAAANHARIGRRWQEEKSQRDRLDRHKCLVLASHGELSEEQLRALEDIGQQLAEGTLPASRRACPECERHFSLVTVYGLLLDCCRFCRGIWFDPGELQLLSRQSKEIPSDDKTSRASKYRCPDCQATMREFVFRNPNNLLVDRCPSGHGVYLKDGELRRVFELG